MLKPTYEANILRVAGVLFDQLLSPKKSPKPRARQSFKSTWIVWICETVAYSEGGVLKPTLTNLVVQLLLPKKSPKPRAR